MKILVIHGPNLNLLGIREPDVYGSTTMEEINQGLLDKANSNDIEIEAFQSNAEHEIVTKLQESINQIDYIIINPGALTHTSIAIRDALLAVQSKFVEVHLSNIFSREDFRQNSYVSSISLGVISGFGHEGYLMALDALSSLNK